MTVKDVTYCTVTFLVKVADRGILQKMIHMGIAVHREPGRSPDSRYCSVIPEANLYPVFGILHAGSGKIVPSAEQPSDWFPGPFRDDSRDIIGLHIQSHL
jgi:hypothetical protein